MGKFRRNDLGGPFANTIIVIILTIWAIAQIYPVFWLFMSSLKPSNLVRARIFDLPKTLYFGNYDFKKLNEYGITVLVYLKNSVIVTSASLLLLMIVSVLAAYGIAKLELPGKDVILVILLVLIGVPVHALMIPIFYFFVRLNMINSYWGLILPYVAFNTPFAVVVLQTYFRQFPNELIDAAKIDGCGDLRAFIAVVMPISLGPVASVLVISFLAIWNEFLFALVMMRDNAAKTLPVGLMGFKGRYVVEWGPMMSALVLAIIPSIIFYFIFSKSLLKGISAGAIKG
ncbi:MAG: carbohydrate ABC transporter permease [Spirochaetota bacterium]|nr:MAG: carbohydrate ABC transporter permease [Spirochaetota bacterium]